MGQKVNPIGLRLGIIRDWDSLWFADKKEYPKLLIEDIKIRKFILKRLSGAGVARVVIERAAKKMKVNIHSSRPGVIIGKKGTGIESLKNELSKMTKAEVIVNIQEIRKAETNATLVAQMVAGQLEKRIAFRRAMKKAVLQALKFGAKGIKIETSGRLGGAEMARREWYREGRVPLHTLRADIDYGFIEAKTTYGQIGVKVWIFKGEVLKEEEKDARA